MKNSAIRLMLVVVVVGVCGRQSGVAFAQQARVPTPAKKISFDLAPGVKLEMILIPAGDFVMGTPESAPFPERQQGHRVRMAAPFYLGKYLVTQEQWEAVMGSNPSKLKGAKNPVEQVSWGDC